MLIAGALLALAGTVGSIITSDLKSKLAEQQAARVASDAQFAKAAAIRTQTGPGQMGSMPGMGGK